MGASAAQFDGFVARSFLVPVLRGVLAVGHARLSFEGRCMAAVLACGPRSAITGTAAAFLRGAVRRAPSRIDVVTASKHQPKAGWIRVRSTRELLDVDLIPIAGIPTVGVPRMLVDLADDMVSTELTDVMHELDHLRLLRPRAVAVACARFRTRRGPGHRRLVNALALHSSGSAGTQSRFERRVIDRLLEAGAPMPEITPRLASGRRRLRPDLLWRSRGLVVEIDGTPHDRQRTHNDDQIKTELLEAAGIRVRRVGYRTWRRDTDAILRTEFGIGR